MKKYYKTNNWKTYNLPLALKERGVHDEEKLPKFYYREDALSLWGAIKEFVEAILALYYHSDDDIKKVGYKDKVSRKMFNHLLGWFFTNVGDQESKS